MGIFSKLGRSISSGFSTGLSAGLRDLSNQYDEEREIRTRQRLSNEDAIKKQVWGTSPIGRREVGPYMGMTSRHEDVLFTDEISKLGIKADNAVTNSQDQFLTSTGERGQEQVDDSINEGTLTQKIQKVNAAHDEVKAYLETNKSILNSEQISTLQNNLTILSETQQQLADQYKKVVLRDTDDVVLAQERTHYGAMLNKFGYEGYEAIIDETVSSPEWRDIKLAEQRYKVVNGLLSQQGGPRKAEHFINRYGTTDKEALMYIVENYRATQELDISKQFIGNNLTNAKNQQEMQHVYEQVNRLPDGIEKENNMRLLFNKSEAAIKDREISYNRFVYQEATNIARQWTLDEKASKQLGKQALTYSTEVQAYRSWSSDDPEVRREAIKQANAIYGDIQNRKSYQRHLIGDLSLPDVVAIKRLQQVNVGTSVQSAKQSIIDDESLTQEERVKALQLFESVGARIGFQTMGPDGDTDTETLTKIHKGFPSWMDDQPAMEDRLVERYIEVIDASLLGQDVQGFPLAGPMKSEIDRISEARRDLEKKEMQGMAPVGATGRVLQRLMRNYFGEGANYSPVKEDPDAAERVPSSPVEEEGLSADLKEQYDQIVSDHPEVARLRGQSLENLTPEEEEIVRKYRSSLQGRALGQVGSAISAFAGAVTPEGRA